MNIADDLIRAFNDGYEKGKADAEAYMLHCGDETPVTNADHIRSMTDDELAKWLSDMIYPECVCCPVDYDGWCKDCKTKWLNWLKEEYTE